MYKIIVMENFTREPRAPYQETSKSQPQAMDTLKAEKKKDNKKQKCSPVLGHTISLRHTFNNKGLFSSVSNNSIQV